MDKLYVGIYDVNEKTGACTKVSGDELGLNGDCKTFLDPAYDIQTIPIGDNIGGVIRSSSTAVTGTDPVTGDPIKTATITLSTDPGPALSGKTVVVAGMGSNYDGIKAVTDFTRTVPVGGDAHFYNTTMLLHGDGTNGATVITDSSVLAANLTATNATVSTTQPQFGTGSLYFNGTNAYVSRAAQAQMGNANYTIEGWVKPTAWGSAQAARCIYWQGPSFNYGSETDFAHFLAIGAQGEFYYTANSQNVNSQNTVVGVRYDLGTPANSAPLNTWTHVAVVRERSKLSIYVNGVRASQRDINPVALNTAGFESVGAGASGNYFMGYIDEFRITRNVARYTGLSFTPQTAAWGDSDTAPTYQIKYLSPDTAVGTGPANVGLVTLPSPKAVDRGELFYIGVLQVGGTANGLHKWSKTTEVTTGQYPRYIGSTFNSQNELNISSVGALPETISQASIAVGDKCWGALGAYKPYVARGSVFYADSFNRSLGSGLGGSWVNTYGSPMFIVQTSDQVYTTYWSDYYTRNDGVVYTTKPSPAPYYIDPNRSALQQIQPESTPPYNRTNYGIVYSVTVNSNNTIVT